MILTTYRVFAALLLFLLVAIYMPEQVASAALAEEKSVRKSGFVTPNGVKLHYLDWGGSGETLLLLAGFGDTAEVFDDFATKFTDGFHVLGLTGVALVSRKNRRMATTCLPGWKMSITSSRR